MTIELPNHDARQYLRAFNVAAIYVAAGLDRRWCLVAVTRDLDQTRARIHNAGLDLISIYWVRERKLGDRLIADLARHTPMSNGRVEASTEYVAALIESAAARHGITLTPNDRTLARVETANRHVAQAMVSANTRGDLQWFNRAYREHRIGHPDDTVSYGQARNRLRHMMVERIASGDNVADQTVLLGELFSRR